MNKNLMLLSLLVMLGSLAQNNALAACAFANNAKSGNVTFALPALTQALNPSDAAPRKLATVTQSAADLASAMSVNPTLAIWAGCTGNLVWTPLRTSEAGTSPEGTGYISTGIENLYFYLYAGSKTTGAFGPFATPTTAGAAWSRSLSTIHASVPPWTVLGNVSLALYQTGPIRQGGVIPAGPVAELSLSDGLKVMTMSTTALTIDVLACTITTPVVNVTLPTMFKNSFTGIGSTSESTSFKIGANCDSGVMPTMTFSGQTSAAGSDVFATNQGKGEATGLGVQLLYADSPVTQNQPVSLATTAAKGAVDFPFSARYVQTDAQVTSGAVHTTITFTLAYK